MARKTLTAKDRDTEIYKILKGLLKDKSAKATFSKPFDKSEIESLFTTSIWGHREVVLTVIMARYLNPKFKASEDFYACNPRSIFEHPIRKALREFAIPHRKSGPLNVAKNIKKINEDWATDKHGGEIAMNVVKIIKKIETVPRKKFEKFATAYVARYKQEAKRIKEMAVDLPAQENPVYITKLCVEMIDVVPDGGATPQIIVGLLMEAMAKDRQAHIEISGHKDSVSTTNTTSKKPGDIIEKINGNSQLIYEVTTKMFTDDRLMESYESVMDYDKKLKDVIVICRPQDVPESLTDKKDSYVMVTTQFKELAYYFVNIFDYTESTLMFLTPAGRKDFYEELTKYVNETNTTEKVKRFYKKWHSENKSNQIPSSASASCKADATEYASSQGTALPICE